MADAAVVATQLAQIERDSGERRSEERNETTRSSLIW